MALGSLRSSLTASAAKLASRVPFSVADLFAQGEDGGWYDPSDLTSMYVSRVSFPNNDTDVVVAGSAVGTVLDKSQMGGQSAATFIAAQPNIAVLPGPYTATTGFTAVGCTLSTSNGALVITSTRNAQSDRAECTQTGLTVGAYYQLKVRARQTVGTAGRIQSFGWASVIAAGLTSNFKDYTFIVQATATSGETRFYSSNGSGVIGDTIEVISYELKEIPGNHLVAPSDAARPVLRDEIVDGTSVDVSGQPNIITNGTFDTDTDWTKDEWTISGGKAQITSATGLKDILQSIPNVANKWYKVEYTVDSISPGGSILSIFSQNGTVHSTTGTKTDLLLSSVTPSNIRIRVGTGTSATIDNVSVREVPASAARRYYLDFDGTDDFYNITPAFGLTGTEDFTVSVGYMGDTLDDGNSALWNIGQSGAADPYDGISLIIRASTNVPGQAAQIRYSNATTTKTSIALVNTSPINIPHVVSGGRLFLKTDGVEKYTSQATAGGDFDTPNETTNAVGAAYTFNYNQHLHGRIYGLVCIFRDLTTAERENLEYFLAQKSGVTYGPPVLNGIPTIG